MIMTDRQIKNLYQEISINHKPIFSFEFFPPKDNESDIRLYKTIDDLKEIQPSFVSITCGAGGSTKSKTKEISFKIQNEYDITVMTHYTSIGITRNEINKDLQELWNMGIQNIMALRGDKPKDNINYIVPTDGFSYASELITHIQKIGMAFSVGGACYPEVHSEACSPEQDLIHLKKKVDAGVDFLITQLFFINEHYFDFVKRCRNMNINVPIIPGIMPITNYKQIERFTKMAGCQFPKDFISTMMKYEKDPEALLKISYEYTLQQCEDLLKHNVLGIHFYTLNKSDITKKLAISLHKLGKFERVSG